MRRRVALGSIAGVSAAALVGCGSEEEPTGAGPTQTDSAATPSETPTTEAPAAPAALASTSDIPVGGGKVIDEQQVVVTQPSKGDFKAFTAVCTHQGCTVSSVSEGTINCACHGSRYAVEDGSVQGGPAPAPLAEVPIKVQGGKIVRG